MIRIAKQLSLILVAFIFISCSDNKRYETSICTLIDISGTYANEKKNVVNIIKAQILPEMVPGDNIFFITIDSNSYNESNIKAKMTLDYRPTKANAQKLAFAEALNEYADGNAQSRFTDISGGMMLCGDYLKSTEAGSQIMFIFSDMKEELPKNVKREFGDEEFTNMHIAAMNVIKLNRDSSNPEIYRNRLSKWEKRVKDAGADSWNIILDPTKMTEFINEIKG